MRKTFYLFFILISCTNYLTAQSKERQQNINSIFDKMTLQGVDTKKPLLYGYFFYDKDKLKLEALKDKLLKENYRLVRLERTDKQEYILHVEKVEIHSKTSLLERENQLYEFSKRYKVATYDGWDVGNADPSKPLIAEDGFNKSLENKSVPELYKLASSLYETDIYDKAVLIFQKCIEANFKKDTCYYKQGVSYINLGQHKTGIEKLETAFKINLKYFKACFNIGATCYDHQEYAKSVEYYQKAAKLEPKDDRIFYGIAASQFALSQFDNAETNCQMALKINPNNSYAKTLLDRIRKKN